MKLKFIYSLLVVIFCCQTAFSQSVSIKKESNTKFLMSRNLNFNNGSDSKSISLEVQKNTLEFMLQISCDVSDGKFMIHITDSEGNKLGNFEIGTQLDSENIQETVGGRISKSMKNPTPGFWNVHIKPVNATGKISIESSSSQ